VLSFNIKKLNGNNVNSAKINIITKFVVKNKMSKNKDIIKTENNTNRNDSKSLTDFLTNDSVPEKYRKENDTVIKATI
jgi:hypothetical protein